MYDETWWNRIYYPENIFACTVKYRQFGVKESVYYSLYCVVMKHLQLDIGQLTHNKLVKKNLRLIEAVDLNWKKLEIINRPRPRGLVCSQQIKGRGRSILQWILARYYYLRAKIHWIFGSSKLIVMPFHK